MDADIERTYGNRLRLRVCGLCWKDERLLLVNHKGLTPGDFWAPPGGGMEFGEPVSAAIQREFSEETGLNVEIGPFLFGCERLSPPLHSIELFFEVLISGGKLVTGDDPELQIIKEVRFFAPDEINGLEPGEIHGIFRVVRSPGELRQLKGFYSI